MKKLRKNSLIKSLKSLVKSKGICKFTQAIDNTVNNGILHYFNSIYISAAGGFTHWVQCLSLFTAFRLFYSHPSRIYSLQNSDK
jgi:hypothetical protein